MYKKARGARGKNELLTYASSRTRFLLKRNPVELTSAILLPHFDVILWRLGYNFQSAHVNQLQSLNNFIATCRRDPSRFEMQQAKQAMGRTIIFLEGVFEKF